MRSQFTDIYSFLGINPKLSEEEIQKELNKIIEKTRQMEEEGTISEKQFKAVRSASEILKDPEKRKKYDKIGHEKFIEESDSFLSEVDFIGGEYTYEDFYDLFGLDPNSNGKKIDKKTAIKIKKSHPDNNNGQITKPEKFETIKIARQVLTNANERRKYDSMGHKKYVQNEIDSKLKGFRFTGEGSIISENTVSEEYNIESLISFTSEQSISDPTEDVIDTKKESEENTNSSSEDSELIDEKDKDTTTYGAKPEDKREEDVKINILIKVLRFATTNSAKVLMLLIVGSSIGSIMYRTLGFEAGLVGFIFSIAIGGAIILKK
jgi:DnaJ-class molecular chaperone